LIINVSRVDDGFIGIEKTLTSHKAKWRKTCFVLCNVAKAERAGKYIQQTSTLWPVKHHLRSKSASSCPIQTSDPFQPVCLFCDDKKGNLHEAEIMSLDFRVRGMTLGFKNFKLLETLSARDTRDTVEARITCAGCCCDDDDWCFTATFAHMVG